MTLVLTQRVAAVGGPSEEGTVRTTSSFTPAANAKLYAWCWVQSPTNTAFTTAISDNTGGALSWSLVASAGPITSSKGRLYLWETTTGGSPSAMTITFTSTATATVAYDIFDVTGTSPAIKAGQIVTNIQNDAFWGTSAQTSTLPAAATTGNLAMLVVGFNCDSSAALSTPSGWTSLSNPAGGGAYELYAVFSRTDFTGTSVTYLNGADNEAIGSVLFEIEQAAVTGPAFDDSTFDSSTFYTSDGQAGAAALSTTSTLGAAGNRTAVAAASLSAASTLTSAATPTRVAAASLSATSSLTSAGTPDHPAAAALSTASTLTAAGDRTAQVAAALSTTASLTSAGDRTAAVSAALSTSATLSATGTQITTQTASAALTATATLASAAFADRPGAAALAAVSTLTTTAVRERPAAATLTTASTLIAGATRDRPAAAALSTSATLVSTGSRTAQPAVALSTTSTLSAAGTRPSLWPDATNTGYTNAPGYTSLADGSGLTIVSDTTYSFYDFPGLSVGSSGTPVSNVTFYGCRISGAFDVLSLVYGTNITYSYCSFEPATVAPPVSFTDGYQYGIATDGAYGSHVAGLTIDHCDFWGYANAITLAHSNATDPVVISDNWFHDHRADGGVDHTDGIGELQGNSMSFVTIHHNSIVDTGNTNGIAFQYGSYTDFTVTDNRIGGWGYAVAIGGPSGPGPIERITFTGNHWTDEVANTFGPLYPGLYPFYAGSGSVWHDNIWEPTGQFWTPTGPADADYQPSATATLSAASTLTADGTRTQPAAASLSASSTLTSGGVRTGAASAALAASSTLTTTGLRTEQGAAALTAAATLTSAAVRQQPGAAALSTSATLVADGTGHAVAIGSVAMTVTSSLSVAAMRTTFATTALTAASTLTTSGLRTAPATTSLSTAATLAVSAVRFVLPAVALSATSTLAALADPTQATVALSTTSTLTETVDVTRHGSVDLSATADLATTGDRTAPAAIPLSATSTLVAAALVDLIAAAHLSATATLTATATVIAPYIPTPTLPSRILTVDPSDRSTSTSRGGRSTQVHPGNRTLTARRPQ